MNNYLSRSTILISKPSFIRGIARTADREGSLDDYSYSSDPDSDSLKQDWKIVGDDLRSAITHYKKDERAPKVR